MGIASIRSESEMEFVVYRGTDGSKRYKSGNHRPGLVEAMFLSDE